MENNINQIIRERRSHFPHEYTGELLDDDIITTLLENANWAPQHTSNYPWRFKIMKDDEIISWLDKAIENYKSDTPIEQQKQKTIDKLILYRTKISHVIVIVYQPDPEKQKRDIEDYCAIGCSVQNIYLSLSQFPHAAGYWSTGIGTYDAAMHEFLGLSDQQQLMGYFILGHVAKKRTESNRKSITNFLLT